ncbi:hypothetical protein NVP1030O_11 [Vibrio phage 1.030.O._10N.222.55.F9]|nr:hypothetical protein NVP1030O_11 [Vibrio phage 1.030.O._10N.222.55.F9]
MATSVIPGLISLSNPIDNSIQTVISKVGEILINESVNQQALALADGKDPELYEFRVFTDRFDPFDNMKENKTPVISIKESDDSKQMGVSANHGKQQKLLTINIDCFGIGRAKETPEGHLPADLDASQVCRRVANLVNKILKADINNNLQLDRKLVNSVNITGEQYFEPDFDSRQLGPVVVKRISLQCNVVDTPVINNGVELEGIVIDVERGDSGEIYTTCEYDYTS